MVFGLILSFSTVKYELFLWKYAKIIHSYHTTLFCFSVCEFACDCCDFVRAAVAEC